MKKLFILVVALSFLGCAHTSRREAFRAELTCGLTVEEVRDLASDSGATNFACYHAGGEEYRTCGALWGRKGLRGKFDSRGFLVAYQEVRFRPLTVVELSELYVLCSEETPAEPHQG